LYPFEFGKGCRLLAMMEGVVNYTSLFRPLEDNTYNGFRILTQVSQ
jgi:hypothetical protein